MHTAVADGLAPEDVLATEEMLARPRKAADLAAEVAAFRELSALMAVDPARVVQRFLELALVLCGAGSSGLSVLAEDGRGEPVFRWDALAGAFAPYVGGTTPRRFSPCGLCLDRDATILVSRPARVFRYFEAAEPEIVEGLVVPVRGIDAAPPLGTLWVVHHDRRGRFDAEDARVMEELAVQMTLALGLLRDAAAREAATQEVHHRVKNTLAATAGVLRLQARAAPSAEARAALEEALGRLGVFASAHDLLCRAATGAGAVEMAALLERLVDALRWYPSCTDGRVRLRVRADEGVSLPPDVAVSLALVANEAVTNACKHAFPDGRAGEVEVRLGRRADGALVLAVRDDGVGLPVQAPEGGLGMRLIRGFVRKVGATLTLSGEGGTTVALTLPAASTGWPEQEQRNSISESSREAGGASADGSRALH
jgi:two-component sensor histidine kinase